MPYALLADPHRSQPLELAGDILRNDSGVWPIVGGVPVLVPSAGAWIAAHRDSLIVALAERGRLRPADVELLDLFAEAVSGVGPTAFADDFLADEEASAALHDRLAGLCDQGPVLEVGCGSGALTRRIRGRPLVVVDRSPRAVVRATEGTGAVGVVGLAEVLPVRGKAFRTVVAANLVDLLDDPQAFLLDAARALRKGGRLVLCTPDPALGRRDGPEGALAELVEGCGFAVEEEEDGLRWSRVHSPRHREEYVVRLVVATKR